ncbi:hypothetical protein [Azonexus fungiphilus]|uniref:hypothetical protein n=1 Tax=Azonexus fungiphilus TaxID=146940 RepID=UPI00156B3A2A|nr:hypothetical protein [Azonexus fungiphilus]NHC08360.1 hypothetical protein [Azonexus fungiphilus]
MNEHYADNNFDELFDYVGTVKTIDVVEQQNSKSKKPNVVDLFLEKGNELAKKHEAYQSDTVVRGNKALYELLSSIYELALSIDEHAQKEKIVKAMRSNLKNQNIKTSSTTPFMTVIVKYVVKNIDRQTAFNYSRALRVANDEKIEVGALADYIAQAGGVSKVTKTAIEKSNSSIEKNESKRRTEALRNALVFKGILSKESIEYEKPVVQLKAKLKGNDTAADTGSFAIFLTYYDRNTQQYKIIEAYDYGDSFEKTILNHMQKRFATTTDALENFVAQAKVKRQEMIAQVAANTVLDKRTKSKQEKTTEAS